MQASQKASNTPFSAFRQLSSCEPPPNSDPIVNPHVKKPQLVQVEIVGKHPNAGCVGVIVVEDPRACVEEMSRHIMVAVELTDGSKKYVRAKNLRALT